MSVMMKSIKTIPCIYKNTLCKVAVILNIIISMIKFLQFYSNTLYYLKASFMLCLSFSSSSLS